MHLAVVSILAQQIKLDIMINTYLLTSHKQYYIIDDLLTPLTESNVTDLGSGSHTPSITERIGEYI